MGSRSIHLCTILLLASCVASPTRSSQQGTSTSKHSRVAIYLGQRSLDEDDWEPVEDQSTLGIEFSNENPDSAIGWEIGFMASEEDDDFSFSGLTFDAEGKTKELYGGIRKTFGTGALRPYVGGGLSIIAAELEVSQGSASVDDDDASAALYLHGGIEFFVTDAFFIGADLRVLTGSDIELFGVDGDADYTQFALVLGFGF